MKKLKQKIEQMYLDYFNNFLSVYLFAEYYNIDEDQAYKVIDIGRRLNHSK
jgi:hypothetical protein